MDLPASGKEIKYFINTKKALLELDLKTGKFGNNLLGASFFRVQDSKLILINNEVALDAIRNQKNIIFCDDLLHIGNRDQSLVPAAHGIRKHRRKPNKNKNRTGVILRNMRAQMNLLTSLLLKQCYQNPETIAVKETPTKTILESKSVQVDALPCTVPTIAKPDPPLAKSSNDLLAVSYKSNPSEEDVKELVISQNTLSIVRNFSNRNLGYMHWKGCDTVSPGTFDRDEEFCRALLYRLNPLVELTKSAMLDKYLIKAKKSTNGGKVREVALEEFAAKLGLVGVDKKEFMTDFLDQRRSHRMARVNSSKKNTPRTQKYKEKKGKRPNIDSSSESTNCDSDFNSDDGTSETSVTTIPDRVRKAAKKDNKGKQQSSKTSRKISIEDKENVRRRSSSSEEPLFRTKFNSQKGSEALKNVNGTKIITSSGSFKQKKKFATSSNKNELSPVTKYLNIIRNDIKRSERLQTNGYSDRSNITVTSPVKRPNLDRVVQSDIKSISDKQTLIKRLANVRPEKRLRDLSSSQAGSSSLKTNQSANRSSIGKKKKSLKAYSMLEDKAILDYLVKEGRGNVVNGNRMWKVLEKTFFALTNQSRTWQSLRNRYLKYILANLQDYGLPYEQEKQLRASAYIGEIKVKKLSRRNSIFKSQPALSAALPVRAARINAPTASSSQPTGEDEVKSGGPISSTPAHSPRRADPTYSQLTRAFNARSLRSSTSSGQLPPTPSKSPAHSRRLFNLR